MKLGLDYLNLHELAICEDNRSRLIDGSYIDSRLIYNSDKHYLPSIIDFYKIIDFIENNNLDIIYNDCSARNMRNQVIVGAIPKK